MNMLKHIGFAVVVMTGVVLLLVSLLWVMALAYAVAEAHGAPAGTAWLVVATGTVVGIITGATDRGR